MVDLYDFHLKIIQSNEIKTHKAYSKLLYLITLKYNLLERSILSIVFSLLNFKFSGSTIYLIKIIILYYQRDEYQHLIVDSMYMIRPNVWIMNTATLPAIIDFIISIHENRK